MQFFWAPAQRGVVLFDEIPANLVLGYTRGTFARTDGILAISGGSCMSPISSAGSLCCRVGVLCGVIRLLGSVIPIDRGGGGLGCHVAGGGSFVRKECLW